MKTTPQTPFSRPATDLRSKRLVRRSPSPLALEQRFMFDGAAVADAVDTVSKPTDTAMPESGAHLLNVATTDARGVSETLVAAQAEAEKLVGQFLNSPDAQAQLFALFNGAQGSEPSVAWQAAFDQLMNSFRNGETPVRVELRHGEELQNALGAFSARGTTGQATIYLNREWVESSASVESLTRVLIEELGHAVDSSLNGAADTQGDEGELFGQMLMDTSSSDSYASDDDHRQLTIDGQLVDVELANSVFDVNSAKLSFDTSTDIVAGTNVGASKLYSNVITVGGQQIDAIITLTGLQNATLSVFDYEGTSNQPYSTAQGGDAYFQPNVGISTAGGYATFSIKFILGNSYNAGSNPTGTAVTLRNVLANTYDLDGASASTSGRQFTDFSGIGGYTLSTTTQIVTSDQGSGVTRFVTTIGGNIQDLPGTEAGDNIRARVSFDEVSTATIKVGDMGATGTAYYGIDFSQGTTFTNARTVDVSISGAPVQTSETGTSDTFSVALTAAPTADVTVTLSGLDGTEGSLSTTTLTFTTSNWNTPQTVTVTGVDDVDVDGDITYTITATTSSLGDSAYNGRTAVIDVTNLDSEGADSTPPTVAITRDTASLKAGETATLTFTFSEDVGSSFTAGDISVSGGTLGALTQVDATHYTAVFTPTPGSTTNGVVSVASGKFTDVAGNANTDGADVDNTATLTVDTARPSIVITADKANLQTGETSVLTFALSEAATDFTAADVTVTGGTLSNFSGSGTRYTATFTPSAISGTVSVASGKFSDAAGNANVDGLDADNRVPLAYDPALSISSVTVNENSPYAVFTVSGLAGQLATLSLTGDSGDTAALAALQYYDPSANAGAGGWIDYTPGDVVSLGGSGNLLVRVALSPEQDATADGPETFKLVATNPSQTASTGGLGTLMDDGTGDYFAADNTTATPALPAGIVLDDDRALAVSDVTVNEGSPYAVFTVTGAAGQKVSLGLANQNVDGTDLGALQYFDGIRWQAYLAGELVTLNDAGKLLVRVALSPEQEFVLDGPELFELVATNTGGSVSTGGLGAINDDGTGAYFAEDNNSADSALPSGVVLDNDKPVPPPQKAPQPPVAVAPPAVELPTPEVRVYIPEIPPVTRVSVEPVKELPSLTVTNQIPEQYVDSGARSKFAIPSDAFAHSDPTEVLQLSAMQANGQPLPGWIRFDASSGTFQVDAPAGYAGELRLMIRARDSKGNEVSSIFRFNVGKKREAERQPASRPSLSEQLKQSGRDTRFALDRIDGKIASSVDAKKVARI